MSEAEQKFFWVPEAENWQGFQACDTKTGANDLFYGLMYGYGCYTSFRYPLSRTLWQAHWRRLQADANILGLSLDGSFREATAFDALKEALEIFLKTSVARVRISIVPRISSLLDVTGSTSLSSAIIMTVSPLAKFNMQAPEIVKPGILKPAILKVVDTTRPMASVKHAQIAQTLYERRLAKSLDADEICFSQTVADKVYLSEAGFANIIAVNRPQKKLLSPDPKCWPCLLGTTVSALFSFLESSEARELGWQGAWGDLSLDSLNAYDAILLSNAVTGLRPVAKIMNSAGQLLWQEKAYVAEDRQIHNRDFSESDLSELLESFWRMLAFDGDCA
ncbi:MAG: aminotransferase class IV [Vampirovibrionales bacterium]|nr:aminotransferase class IV [Vampirovibrionales bacterium]